MGTSEEIQERVLDHLTWDSRVEASEVRVAVEGHTVTLTGTVPTWYARRAAEEDAYGVRDVKTVENKLSVRYYPGVSAPDDGEVQSYVENLLYTNPDIDASKIRVHVRQGVVTLEGSVEEYWKRPLAEQLASAARGAVDVINRLTVIPPDTRTDREIAEEIVAAMDRSARVDSATVEIRVENRVVTLSGTVPNRDACLAARDTAVFTRGVIDVHNQLVIGGASIVRPGIAGSRF